MDNNLVNEIANEDSYEKSNEKSNENIGGNVKKKKYSPDITNICVLLLDYIFIILAYVVAVMALCDISSFFYESSYLVFVVKVTPFYALFVSILFFVLKLYPADYNKVGLTEGRRLLIANIIAIFIYVIIMIVLKSDLPYIFFLVGGLLQFLFTLGIRFMYRLVRVDGELAKKAA